MGRACIFIRLTGCKLRCTYCDTKYSYFEGQFQEIPQIIENIKKFPTKLVLVTGGEPLEQKECPTLLKALVAEGYEVLLETDGVESVESVPPEVKIIFDVKTPGSGMFSTKTAKNIKHLPPESEVKFVLCGLKDYQFAKEYLQEYDLMNKYKILFSPAMPSKDHSWLAEQILADGLDVRMQIQMHKIIWGDKRGV